MGKRRKATTEPAQTRSRAKRGRSRGTRQTKTTAASHATRTVAPPGSGRPTSTTGNEPGQAPAATAVGAATEPIDVEQGRSSGRSPSRSAKRPAASQGPVLQLPSTQGQTQSCPRPSTSNNTAGEPSRPEYMSVQIQDHTDSFCVPGHTNNNITGHESHNIRERSQSGMVRETPFTSSFPAIVPPSVQIRTDLTQNSHCVHDNEATGPNNQIIINTERRPNTKNMNRGYHHPHYSPLNPVGDTLGESIPQSIKEKIWKGEYVDLNLLVNAQDVASNTLREAAEQRTNLAIAEEEGKWVLKPYNAPSKNKIMSIEIWTNAFLIYMSVYLAANPRHTREILKYCHLIRSAASRYYGYGWRDYDIEFRHRFHATGGSWAEINGELWLLHVVGGGSPRSARGPAPIHQQWVNKEGKRPGVPAANLEV
nr:uncharacterized protein LOC129283562 [Lytechinus pictus]